MNGARDYQSGDGAYGERLVEYLKEALRAKGSAGAFEKSMGVDLDRLEREWRQWIAAMAR